MHVTVLVPGGAGAGAAGQGAALRACTLRAAPRDLLLCCGPIAPPEARAELELARGGRAGLLRLRRLVVDGETVRLERARVTLVLYDELALRGSERWPVTDDLCARLRGLLGPRRDPPAFPAPSETPLPEPRLSWSMNSVFVQHLKKTADILHWLFKNITSNKCVSIQAGNMLMALMMDIIIGYFVLNIVIDYKNNLSDHLMEYLEVIVNYLRSLLKWLMGAPAGLKLNKAFNNMLGKFFLYHIELWWMFLELMKGASSVILQLYYCFGYMGITFQAAIISDMISFISFHAYCIYVYVARLFNIQVSGLAALLRLFVGRKKNPLRGRVDSCEYTNQELFVGTVAFTILLFLLPTTAMYYIVFTLFRLLSLSVQLMLARLCHSIQTLPLYVTILWLIGSPRVAGNVHMEVVEDQGDSGPLLLQVKLTAPPLGTLIKTYRPPPLEALGPAPWTDILYKVFRGNLINSM